MARAMWTSEELITGVGASSSASGNASQSRCRCEFIVGTLIFLGYVTEAEVSARPAICEQIDASVASHPHHVVRRAGRCGRF